MPRAGMRRRNESSGGLTPRFSKTCQPTASGCCSRRTGMAAVQPARRICARRTARRRCGSATDTGEALSPDGTWALAFVRNEAVLLPTRAGMPRKLPRGTLTLLDEADWLPDGRRIVISGRDSKGSSRVYVQRCRNGLASSHFARRIRADSKRGTAGRPSCPRVGR